MSETETPPAVLRDSDGAKPGTAAHGAKGYAYNADEHAAEREAAPITIGGQQFYRRRKNWRVSRVLRRLMRVQERNGLRQDGIAKRIKDADPDDEAAFDALFEQQDKLADESDDAAYEIVGALLKDTPDGEGESPTVDFLKDSLDLEDVGELSAQLMSGGAEDPTKATPSS